MSSYARLEVALTLLIGLLVSAVTAHFFGCLWALLPGGVALALLSFYRDPPRRAPAEDNVILSAADGRIVEIARNADGPDGRRVLRVVVFLSVFNVHVNRSPCAGRVREVIYRPGEFRNALKPDAGVRNESNTLVIDPAPPLPGPVHVRQIAGVLARRIVCAARPGDQLAAGQRFGMIKLGSRAEVCVPEDLNWDICVEVGQSVKGGLSVLARLPRPSAGQSAT